MLRQICLWVILVLAAGGSARAQYVPSWWVSDPNNPVLVSGATSDNYAPANLGQLKWMAVRAKAHFDATIPGGASPAINTMVAGFGLIGNYKPINVGQLKAVVLPFYDQLWALTPRYDTTKNLIANGFLPTWGDKYPWDSANPPATNFLPANIGQLKLAFSFDLVDANHNGTLDYLEGIYPAALATPDDWDADGVPNSQDAYPHDPTRSSILVSPPGDTTAPTITVNLPTGATIIP